MKIKSRSLSNSDKQDTSNMQIQVQDKIAHFLEDMIRYVICNLCNTIKCPNCQEWMNEGEDGLSTHYYLKGCVLTK